MKKLVAITVILGALFMNTSAQANTSETATATPKKLPSSIIDNIEVPFEVLDYAQMKYQGYAVTQVQSATLNGQQIYRLRVDRDDLANDYDSIFLIYTTKWKLITDEKMVAPPVVSRPTPSEEKDNIREQLQEEPETPERQQSEEEIDHVEQPDEPVEPDEEGLPEDDDAQPGRRGRGNWEY